MNRADRCVWRYRAHSKNTAHAFDLYLPRQPLCRRADGTLFRYRTEPETSPTPLCLACLREVTRFREYAQRRR